MSVRILVGDCRQMLHGLPEGSVHCCVTSPPYWGLRDYGTEDQIGLEETPEAFVAEMVNVFRSVRRVLRDDGTLWLNLGDSYAGSWGGQGRQGKTGALAGRSAGAERQIAAAQKRARGTGSLDRVPGLKAKDLVGIPWRVAFALQADGWYLRSDIIWHKPNPMPESVTDRPTKSHEYLFLMSKSERYFYDAAAIKEPCTQDEFANGFRGGAYTNNSTFDNSEGGKRKTSGNIRRKSGVERGCPEGTGSNVCGSIPWEGLTRNKRDVWTVGSKPFTGAHFATFPPDLIEPCIKAGSPAGGMVLDPFGGAGTTGMVADRLGRSAVLIELNPAYASMGQERLQADGGMLSNVTLEVAA